jgi:hypothetical protein
MTDDRRSTDRRRPTDERPPVRFQSRLAGGDRSPLIPIVALVVLAGIAALSSGPAAPGATNLESPTTESAAEAVGLVSPAPSSAPNSRADADVATICLEPASWRTATIETWRDQTVRVWRAIDPVVASGPDDPAIPIVPAVGNSVAAIGFCAPVVGPDRPSGPVTVEAWRRGPVAGDVASPGSGPVAAGAVGSNPVPLEIRPIVPAGSPSPFGALFGPPDAEAGTGWPPGVVVFRYAPLAGGPSAATWFAIEIIRTDASGKGPPTSERPRFASPLPLRP